ncbi:MAG: PAS domain S-box protein, partial [Desulfobacterales bacterium]|nr:PAS domain S-box protein [Desulfobacterales bacterium]
VKNFEWQIIRKDGDRRDIEVSISLIRNTEGHPTGFRGIVRDTTDRKRVEKALRESEERWKFALEGAGDGVWDWDAVTNRVYFSNQWKAMLGHASHEVGDTLDEWDRRVHPEDKTTVYADLERHFRRETEIYQNEHRLLCKDGSYKWILDRGKVIEWTEDEKPRRVIGTHTDITERKRAEEALKASLSLLNASLESTADGILIVDRKGKITQWNQKFADMWKIPEDVLYSRDDEKAINHILTQLADPEQFAAKVRKLYEQPEESSFDQIEFADGRVFERYSQPQRIEDEIAGRVWSFRDITERKMAEAEKMKLEEQYSQAQKMEAIGQLAGGVAHDFNNMLNIILGYSQMALMKVEPSGPLYANIQEIMNAAQRSSNLVRQLLAFARKQTIAPKALDLNDTVAGML